jgi:hypothetical protein
MCGLAILKVLKKLARKDAKPPRKRAALPVLPGRRKVWFTP